MKPEGRALIVLAMREPTKTAAHADLKSGRSASRRNRFIEIAPDPEAPVGRDKVGAQRGMALALLGGSVFWAAAGAVVVYFLRR